MKQNIVDLILENIPDPSIISDSEIEVLMQGSTRNQRYGVVKRAIASGRLIRIRRGLYCLDNRYLKKKPNLFELAGRVYGPSYISFQSALSFHQWIPEAVYTITSACIKRNRTFNTPLGIFSYLKIPESFAFFNVIRYEENGDFFYIAEPWKALLDYMYAYKKNWQGTLSLFQDLRIEKEALQSISTKDLVKLAPLYKSRKIDTFVLNIMKELNHER
jgi:hypothetical protein